MEQVVGAVAVVHIIIKDHHLCPHHQVESDGGANRRYGALVGRRLVHVDNKV